MQQPLYPAKKSPLQSRRPERCLTALAPGVRGAASLPALPMRNRTRVSYPKEVCSPSGVGRQENPNRSEKWVKCSSPTHFITHFTIHFTRIERPSLREINALHMAEKIGLHAAEILSEAGATPAFDARCVTALHGVAPASLTVKIETLDGEEFICTGSRDGFPVKKVRFSFCTSEIATSSLCRKRISRESKNLGENARTKIASEKTKNWAGATPSCRKIVARSLRASGVTPASCC